MIGIDDRVLSSSRRKEILERDDYCCAYCYGSADQVDHIVPWAYVHDDSDENLVACCWLCNLLASDKVFKSFKDKRDYLTKRRYQVIEKKPTDLRTEDDLKEFGPNMQNYIRETCVVCKDEKEMMHVRKKLMSEGWKVKTRNKTLDEDSEDAAFDFMERSRKDLNE